MPTYSDAEMRAIMGRALQIDSSKSDRFTPEQLRSIATELGISNQALEVALYEADKGVRPLGEPERVPAPNRWWRMAGIAALVVVTAGAIAIAVRRGGETHDIVERSARSYPPAAEVTPAPTPRAVEPTPAPARATRKTSPGTTTKTPAPPPP